MASIATASSPLRGALFSAFGQKSSWAILNSATLKSFLPVVSQPLHLPSWTVPAISLNIPGLLAGIWEGILKAVPKKKTSHMKKRHRQLAGKALKDVRSVNTCSACGRPKKAHVLCPYCVSDIKQEWAKATKKAVEETKAVM